MPARRAAGLDQHRMDLRRRHAIERAAHLEEFSRMIDGVNLGRIGDDAGLTIPTEGVGSRAIPERAADVDELLHALVAQAMFHQLVEAVVRGVGTAAAGNDVEGDAPVGDVVQRIEKPGHIERVHEGRRIGQAEPDMLGYARHRRDHRAHVVTRPADAPAHRLVARSLPGVRDAGAVPEEQHVDATAFGDARDLLVDIEVGIGSSGP